MTWNKIEILWIQIKFLKYVNTKPLFILCMTYNYILCSSLSLSDLQVISCNFIHYQQRSLT